MRTRGSDSRFRWLAPRRLRWRRRRHSCDRRPEGVARVTRRAPAYDRAIPAAQIHPTSIVSPEAVIGRDVTIEPLCVIHPGVVVGDGSFIGSHSALGSPTADYFSNPTAYEPAPCRIGRNAVIRSHSVFYAGTDIGDDFSCGHRVTIREGSRIGDGVQVGTGSDLQGKLSIGSYSRLHSGVFVPQFTTIEEFVWVFPHAILLNDPHPPSDTCTQGPTIRRFAVIGANATISASVEVGEGALVGAMSLVRSDVPTAHRRRRAFRQRTSARRPTSCVTKAGSRASTRGGDSSGGAIPTECYRLSTSPCRTHSVLLPRAAWLRRS